MMLVVLAAGALAAAIPATAAARRHRHHAAGHARAHLDGQCANADLRATRASAAEMRAAVVCLVNETRQSHGLPPLRSSRKLNRAAQNWTDSMVASGNFSEGNPGARASAVGFDWSTVGENIATGFETPAQVVAGWMRSQGHCYNILDPVYTEVGTGVSRHPVSGFGATPSTWTQDFGLPMGHRGHSGNWGPASHCPYN